MEYIYAVLLLHKLGKELTEDSVKKVVESAGVSADMAKIKTILASLKGVDIEKALKESVAMPVQAAAGAATAAAKPEEKKEEKQEESVEGLAALFG
jgi:large subunit ribosomal protein L12